MGERWGKMGKKWAKNEITGVQKTALMHASAHLGCGKQRVGNGLGRVNIIQALKQPALMMPQVIGLSLIHI